MSTGVQHIRLRHPEPIPPPKKPVTPSGILQDQVRRKAPWTPSFSFALRMFLLMRTMAATYSNIDDCDEVFNFWEPLHFLFKGYGFQTWEVSPEFAIRSWAYVSLHLPAAHVGDLVSLGQKRAAFFAVRMFLGLVCAFVEATLCDRVQREVNQRVGRYLFFMLLFSAGMWNASTALLPSSFAMYATTLAFAVSVQPANLPNWQRTIQATVLFASAGIVGWPFALALGIPFVFEELFVYGRDRVPTSLFRKWAVARWSGLVRAGMLSLLLLIPVIGVDSLAYGKLVVVPWNIVSYNLFSSGKGPDLYGTSPWTFYFLNLLLNFNVLLPLALLSLPVLALTYRYDKRRLGFIPTTQEESSPFTILALRLAPFYLWFTILTSQAHKEERFMFPAYPILCFNAAVTLYLVRGLMEALFIHFTKSPYQAGRSNIFPTFTMSVLFGTVVLSGSRILANWHYYHAPLDVAYHFETKELPILLNASQLLPHPLPPSPPKATRYEESTIDLSPVKELELTLCLGKEWHRFPSHFLVPDNIHVAFIKSEFNGMLPGNFLRNESYVHPVHPLVDRLWSKPQTRYVPSGLNDRNEENPLNYVLISQCSYLIDLDFPAHPSLSSLEPRYAIDNKTWERTFCAPFLDAANSGLITRTLWLPGTRWRDLNSWGDYCLLKNRRLVESKVVRAKSISRN